jgi:hypothetical protein
MPKVDPRRHRSAVVNFRTTPAVKRYIVENAKSLGENVSDFVREAIKVRLEIRRTYKDVAESLGFKDPETMVWHAVQEYSKRHADVPVQMPAKPQPTQEELSDA